MTISIIVACKRISLAFTNTDGLGWMSEVASHLVCSQPLPPGSSFFLLIQEKGLQKEGCRSNAAEAGRSRSRALDDKQNLVPLREVSWLHRAWVERSKEEAALRPKAKQMIQVLIIQGSFDYAAKTAAPLRTWLSKQSTSPYTSVNFSWF